MTLIAVPGGVSNMLNALISRLFPLRREVTQIRQQLKQSFSHVKEESEDHLQAINENTNEIQNNYEMICRLESKIDKLAEKIDELYLMNGVKASLSGSRFKDVEFEQLTKVEMEVFLMLYAQQTGKSLSSHDIAKLVGITSFSVETHIRSMVRKKIPIIVNLGDEGSLSYCLDEGFRDYQRKTNVLGVDEALVQSLFI